MIPQENPEITPVVYAPPGYLLFVRNGNILMAQPFDARRLQLTGEPFRLADGFNVGGPGSVPFSVSAGGILAYRKGVGADVTQPAWFGRDGRQLGAAGPPGPYSSFDLSPDGRTLAASRSDAGTFPSIWLIPGARHGLAVYLQMGVVGSALVTERRSPGFFLDSRLPAQPVREIIERDGRRGSPGEVAQPVLGLRLVS